ncbi:AcrR family transcriptional regulator [Nocardia transvalensis]|uniref:AcrR family transcriptional regulator n=1 Tax=Nocardia transvalensis TaxID=37333 RepID=A0A7W9PDJ7_9NOCA|nr:TetR/AcrR family transcriptional regulator [Nocardia transvalensis]MBB5914154.1 AcrR family transcriptional regulator [Nocardia transvalensis]
MARGADRERAILSAAYDLLGEIGYGALTMDAVAARAQASKATIYRRWQGKPALVKAALDAHDAEYVAEIADTGTLRGDLIASLTALCAQVDERYVTMITGLMHAMRVDPELALALKSHVADEDLGPFRIVVRRAVARGELAEDADSVLAHQVSEGQIMRRMFLGEPVDAAFLAGLVDGLLIPLLTRSFPEEDRGR